MSFESKFCSKYSLVFQTFQNNSDTNKLWPMDSNFFKEKITKKYHSCETSLDVFVEIKWYFNLNVNIWHRLRNRSNQFKALFTKCHAVVRVLITNVG
jgi:hypothetical protein